MLKYLQRLYKIDWLLIAVVLILAFWGLSVIYSIALGQGAVVQDSIWQLTVVRKQIIALIIGVILFFIFSFINYKVFYIYNRYLLLGIILLLAGVLMFGITVRGTTGWFEFFGFGFQPVEVAKLVLILILARYFTSRARYLSQFSHVVITGILTLIIVGLILAQPDFGSAVILFVIWVGMMFASGIPKKYLAILGVVMMIFGVLAWFFVFQDYQKQRIQVFIDPQSDPMGAGYNVTQSIIAIGAGQLFGKGLGFGSQSQLKFLPESHTDFIFAVIAEEMGFLSVIFFIILFGFLFYRLIRIGKNSLDDFGLLVCVGVAVSLFSQLFINIGMNMGLAPVAGLPLPFVSFGGSSLIMSFVMLGIVQNIHIKSQMQGVR